MRTLSKYTWSELQKISFAPEARQANIFRADYIDRIGKFRFPFAAARIGDRGAVDHVIGPDLTEQRQEPGGVTDVRRTA